MTHEIQLGLQTINIQIIGLQFIVLFFVILIFGIWILIFIPSSVGSWISLHLHLLELLLKCCIFIGRESLLVHGGRLLVGGYKRYICHLLRHLIRLLDIAPSCVIISWDCFFFPLLSYIFDDALQALNSHELLHLLPLRFLLRKSTWRPYFLLLNYSTILLLAVHSLHCHWAKLVRLMFQRRFVFGAKE